MTRFADEQTTSSTPPLEDRGEGASVETEPRDQRSRLLLFATICGVAVLVAAGYLLWAARSTARHGAVKADSPAERALLLGKPHLLFTEGTTARLANYPLVMAALDSPNGEHYHPGLSCERVYFAVGEGLCLTVGGASSAGSAVLFDQNFNVRSTIKASGLPSRARISADGRYGAMTFFVSGDSYATAGQFSTRTSIIDMQSGTVLANLEDFTVRKDGQVLNSPNRNFWGITFEQNSDHFYATMGSGDKTYLIEGDIAAREAHTLIENVECPSLSPDQQHIVFKRRIADGPPAIWRLSVLDLQTMQVTPLSETRNVDDQAEWLDNSHVLYTPYGSLDTWVVPSDGSGAPKVFAYGVLSPAVAR
jgi:hypothetical protein